MSSNFAREMVRAIGSENVTVFGDGLGAAEFAGFIDTGSYTMNAALSGSIFGGLADNKITGIAGVEASGKTFLALSIIKSLMDSNPDAIVAYFDTEAAVTNKMLESRGIDPNRVMLIQVDTIQNFQHEALKMLNLYLEKKEAFDKTKDKPKKTKKNEVATDKPFFKMMFVLDSLGMLSSTKEITDISAGSETRDMTKSQLLKATFRAMTLKIAKANVPMIVTNHLYDAIGSYKPKEMSGGTALKYAASSIAYLTKGKEKEKIGKKDIVVGTVIYVNMVKSRLSKENIQVTALIRYDTGLDRYYGLLDLIKEHGLVKYSAVKQGYNWPDGRIVKADDINDFPEEYWTDEVLKKVDEFLKPRLQYGSHGSLSVDFELADNEEIDSETGEIVEKKPELLLEDN